jgi:hypothetical protein
MTAKTIWTLNFGTTSLLLAVITFMLLKNIDLTTSDKDIIVIYVTIFVGLFIMCLTYLFYSSIHRWGQKSRLPFYLTSLIPLGLSGLLLYENLGQVDVNYTTYSVTLLVTSGLNVTTYFWALITDRGFKDVE